MTAEAMKKYFDQVDMVQLRDIEINLGKEGKILYRGQPLPNYDCIYLKGSFRYANLLSSIAALLEGNVPYMPLPQSCFNVVHNKLLTHLVLQQKNIPMPKTYLSPTTEAAKELLQRTNFPIVMKFPEGTQGKGVMFADSISSASSLLDALGALNQPFIIQEYIETGGTDLRALVIGDKVVAAMKRTAKRLEKRANLHAGGTGENITLSREASNLALDTAQALKAEICGVDILDGPLGPLVIEANISPGLQGLSQISSVNVADEIAKYLFRKTEEVVSQNNNSAAAKVMQQISINESTDEQQQIVASLTMRGDRILLPPLVGQITKFSDRKEYLIKVKKGRVEIQEFN